MTGKIGRRLASGGSFVSCHDAIFFQFRNYIAVRSGRYKLLRTAPDEPFQLFDLHTDVGETQNLAAEHPALAALLNKRYEQWEADVGAPKGGK